MASGMEESTVSGIASGNRATTAPGGGRNAGVEGLGGPGGADRVPVGGLSHRQVLVVFSGLMLGMLLAALDQTIVATALPTIVGDLHGLNELSWVVTAYLLTSTATAPLYGKVSDIYGRKRVFQFSIVVFLVGSALSGLSQSMGELILFRGLQGLGAGGLLVLALTIIGDIVSPRERGRYQGYFGAVFGVASVVGPVLGGALVDGPGWRWVFYVNLPIGIVALVVTSLVLKDTVARARHRVDVEGAALVVGGVSALLLVTVWGGSTYAWGSPTIIGLALGGVALLVAFFLQERRAAEPLMPLGLFRLRVFNVSNAMGLVVGLAMFGVIIYLPLYLQVVHGYSPSTSGLLLLPLMAGLLIVSIASGSIITRVGRYKAWPIAGTALMTVSMVLFTHLGAHTSYLVFSAYAFVMGAGLGGVMQVLVLAVQNGVSYEYLGVATSLSSFFRSMGGAFGTALFGSILTNRLTAEIPRLAPPGVPVAKLAGAITGSPAALASLPPEIHRAAVEAFVRSLGTVFAYGVPIVAVAFVLSLVLPELTLRNSIREGGGETEGAVLGEESEGEANLQELGPIPGL